MKIFETVERSCWILSNFLCQFWKGQSILSQILYPSSASWNITPLHFFSSNNIYLAENEAIKMKIFDTFKCSVQNLWNFLCQFWNDTSIPLQILYLFSGSWKIITLYFFSSKNIYFPQKEPINRKIFWDFRVVGSNFVKILLQILKTGVDSSPHFVSLFQFHERLLLCTFLAQTLNTLLIRSPLKWQSRGLSSVQVKISQIPSSNFETTSRFCSKFCIPFQFHEV